MSKILMFSNRLIIGGPSVHLLSLVEHFCNDHEILLLYGAPLDDELSMEQEFRKFDIQMYQIANMKRSLNPIPDIFIMAEIKKLLKEFSPDIIHTHTYKPGIIGRYLAKRHNVKRIIHTYHGLIFDSYFSSALSKVLVHIDTYLAKSTDVIIALSEIQKQQILDKIGNSIENKIQIIPLSISQDKFRYSKEDGLLFRNNIGVSEDRILLAMVGRVADVKNIAKTIDVFSELKKDANTNNSTLVIVGDGDQKNSLIAQARALSLKVDLEKGDENSDIIFVSWQREIQPLYSAIDILVLSSKNEGTPLNIIEAQLMKTAILAPRVGGIPDIVVEGKTALLFDNRQEMFAKMHELISNRTLIGNLQQNALKFAKERFSISKMLESYNKLYNI
ncbi:MAG: hypothetical protein DRI86_11150 [Bacteroidetes bacterium]|nr:MAG: hypothetical protein DRI86_11150 [Bacteroidota bacterium]